MRWFIALVIVLLFLVGCDGDKKVHGQVASVRVWTTVYKCGKNAFCTTWHHDFTLTGSSQLYTTEGDVRQGDEVEFTYNPTWGVSNLVDKTDHHDGWVWVVVVVLIMLVIGGFWWYEHEERS